MKKAIILLGILLGLNVISFSYEDYYEKVYTVKISKESVYREIGATEKQKKKLDRIFKKYQKKAEQIENKLLKFDDKKKELGKVESERYKDIADVLSAAQLHSFNIYINSQKAVFEKKNDKIRNLIDSLDLTNEQKSEILRYERNFQRDISRSEVTALTPDKYISEYKRARNIRNEKMRGILSEEQIRILENSSN